MKKQIFIIFIGLFLLVGGLSLTIQKADALVVQITTVGESRYPCYWGVGTSNWYARRLCPHCRVEYIEGYTGTTSHCYV